MARLHAPFSLTGPLGELVLYERKDLPGITLVRSASSLGKERLRRDPCFENSRRSYREAGGRSCAAKALRNVLRPLEAVRDGNWQARLTAALLPVQRLDGEGDYGERGVLLSRHGYLLEGFGLSRRTPFESLIRAPIPFDLEKAEGKATLELPPLLPGTGFTPRTHHPYFSVVAILGTVPDIGYTSLGYAPVQKLPPLTLHTSSTGWQPTKKGAPARTLELQLPLVPLHDAYALVLAVGVLFGAPDRHGYLQPVPYSGSGRILAIRG